MGTENLDNTNTNTNTNSSEKEQDNSKQKDYVSSLFEVCKMVNSKAHQNKDKKLAMICLVIFNYTKFHAKKYNLEVKSLLDKANSNQGAISLAPIFDYISANNIQLYDFSTMKPEDIDTSKNEDLERFALTHVYYITQMKN